MKNILKFVGISVIWTGIFIYLLAPILIGKFIVAISVILGLYFTLMTEIIIELHKLNKKNKIIKPQ